MSRVHLPQTIQLLQFVKDADWNDARLQTLLANWGSMRVLVEAVHDGKMPPERLEQIIAAVVSEGSLNPQKYVPKAPRVFSINDYFTFVSLMEASEIAPEQKEEVSQYFSCICEINKMMGNDGAMIYPICHVRPGFHLGRHPQLTGKCHRNWRGLSDILAEEGVTNVEVDAEYLVFWLPRLHSASINVAPEMQLDCVNRILPVGYPFLERASGALTVGLLLAYEQKVKRRLLMGSRYAASSSEFTQVGGIMLFGAFGESGLQWLKWKGTPTHEIGILPTYILPVLPKR